MNSRVNFSEEIGGCLTGPGREPEKFYRHRRFTFPETSHYRTDSSRGVDRRHPERPASCRGSFPERAPAPYAEEQQKQTPGTDRRDGFATAHGEEDRKRTSPDPTEETGERDKRQRQVSATAKEIFPMSIAQDRRRETRIYFSWPLWFGYDDGYGELQRGQIVDLSEQYVSFNLPACQCPEPGTHVLTRFSYPLNENHSEMGSYLHWSEVIRVDRLNDHIARVALRLHRPITLRREASEKLTASLRADEQESLAPAAMTA